MADIIIVLVLLAVLISAAVYVVRAKKNGKKCIGCPGGCCSGNCSACSGSCNENQDNTQ